MSVFEPPLPADPPSYECRECGRWWGNPQASAGCCVNDEDDR